MAAPSEPPSGPLGSGEAGTGRATAGETLSARPRVPNLADLLAGPWKAAARFAIPGLLVLAFIGFAGNSLRLWSLVVLAAAIAIYVSSVADLNWSPPGLDRVRAWTMRPSVRLELQWQTAAAIGIMLIALFFRFYQLDSLPREMTSDHAEKYLDIQTIQSGQTPIFFPRNAGREGTEFYLASLLTGLTGYTYLTLKLVMCTVSVLEVPFMYLLGRTISGPTVGLAAALFLAMSKWDIGIAREAFRASFAPLWSVVCLLLLYRALASRGRNDFLLLGGAMGLGLYGYTSFRVVLLFVLLVVLGFVAFDRGLRPMRRAILGHLAMAYGLTIMVALPLVRYALDFPGDFLSRAITRSTAAETSIAEGVFGAFIGNVVNMLLMFNVRGDRSWVQGVPGDPQLDPFTGGLFVIGAAYAAYRVVRRRDLLFASLLVGMLILTLPSTLALAFPIENPHANRASPVIPIAFLLAALPLGVAWRWLSSRSDSLMPRAIGGVAIAAVALMAMQSNFQTYFVNYRAVHLRSTPNATEIAAVIRDFGRAAGTDRNAHIVLWPFWLDHRVVALEMGNFAWKETALLDRAEDARRDLSTPGPKLYVLNREDARSPGVLAEIYPQGSLRTHTSAVADHDFRSFFVPG